MTHILRSFRILNDTTENSHVKVTGLNYIDVIMVQVLKDFISRIIFQYSMHLIWGPPGDCPDLPFVLARECLSAQATQRVHTIVELILDNQHWCNPANVETFTASAGLDI